MFQKKKKKEFKQVGVEYFQSGLDDKLNSQIEHERFRTGKKGINKKSINLSIFNK